MMNVEIAQRLAELRRERGFSQEGLAEQLGLSRQAVSKWERAESAPDMGNLIALADLYEVTLDELLRVSPEVAEDVRYESQERAESAETEVEAAAESARAAAERAEAAAVAVTAVAAEGDGTQKVVVEVAAPSAVAPAPVPTGAPVPPAAVVSGFGFSVPPMTGVPASGGARPPMPGGVPAASVPPMSQAPMGAPVPMPPAPMATGPMAPPPPAKPNDPLRSFPYAVLCAAIYLLIGFCFGWWHPGWVIFFTIPFYYWIVSTLEADPAYQTWLVERERSAREVRDEA